MVDQPTPCPSAEELAAFLDGTLDAGRRSAVLGHVADCPDCTEILAGAAAVQAAVRRDPTPELKLSGAKALADVVPIGRGRARTAARRERLWIGLAAAALLALGVALLLPSHRGDGGFPPARDVAAALRSTGDPAAFPEHFWSGDGEARSFGATLTPSKIAFRTGVLLTDLQLAVAAGDETAAGDVVARLSPLLAGEAESAAVSEVLAAITRGDADGAADETAELARALELRLPAQPAAFGRWAESGRLAARARRGAYFTRPEVREFPRELDAPPAPISRELKRIAATLRRGVASEADYATLERAFEQLQLLD